MVDRSSPDWSSCVVERAGGERLAHDRDEGVVVTLAHHDGRGIVTDDGDVDGAVVDQRTGARRGRDGPVADLRVEARRGAPQFAGEAG